MKDVNVPLSSREPFAPSGRVVGTITRTSHPGGYAFVEIPGQHDQYFLHVAELVDWDDELNTSPMFHQLRPGSRLSFVPRRTPRGLRAFEARIEEAA